MNRFKRGLALGIFSVFLFSLAACGGGNGKTPSGSTPGDSTVEQDFDFDYVPHYGVTEPEPETPDDTVYTPDPGPLAPFRMEAESAEYTMVGGQVFRDTENMGFDLRLSGNLATRNLNKNGTVGTYRFNANKSYSGVKLVIMISGCPTASYQNLQLGSILRIRMNGYNVDTAGQTVNYKDCVLLGHNDYMRFKTVELTINIRDGENKLELTAMSDKGGNIDYVELQTSATISGWNANWPLTDETAEWKVTKQPTMSAKGTITCRSNVSGKDRTVSYTLPELSEENGYHPEIETGEVKVFSFNVRSQKFTVTASKGDTPPPLTPERPDPVPVPDGDYPADAAPFAPFRMEAEHALYTLPDGVSYNEAECLGFDLRFSGNLATRNLNKPGINARYWFTSDKSLSNVELKMVVGGYPKQNLALKDIVTIYVNENAVDTDGITVNAEECEQLGDNQYMIFKEVTLHINIREGANLIRMQFIQPKSMGGNFDYIELNTSAKITEWEDSIHLEDKTAEWKVTKAPTADQEGTLQVTATGADGKQKNKSYTLPTLSEANGYTKQDEGGKTVWFFTVCGKKFQF